MPATMCTWVMITGDSNSRSTLDAFRRLPYATPLASAQLYPRPLCEPKVHSKLIGVGCQPRWFDQEHLLLRGGGGCLALSFRFMMFPGESERGLRVWDDRTAPHMGNTSFVPPLICPDTTYRRERWRVEDCHRYRVVGSCYENISPGAHAFPKRPDFFLLAHGLWQVEHTAGALVNAGYHLPDDGFLDVARRVQPACRERFAGEVKAMRRLRGMGVAFAWQTNFPVNSHHLLNNRQIGAETDCQRLLAAEHGFPLLDLWKAVSEKTLQVDGGVHLVPASSQWVAAEVLRRAGASQLLSPAAARPDSARGAAVELHRDHSCFALRKHVGGKRAISRHGFAHPLLRNASATRARLAARAPAAAHRTRAKPWRSIGSFGAPFGRRRA